MHDILRPTLAVLGIAAALSAQSLVVDLAPGPSTGQTDSPPQPLGTIGGRVVFAAHGGPGVGRELFVSDGTPAGTHLVREIRPGPDDAIPLIPDVGDRPQPSFVAGGLAFFPADDGVHGLELWCSDGTANGTRLIADLAPGLAASAPVPLAVLGTRFLFTATDGTHGRELWISDGSAVGTVRLTDAVPGSGDAQIASAVVAGGLAYFAARSGNGDRELWRTDGTPAGTHVVVDLYPGPSGSIPNPLCAHGNELLFAATTPAFGQELWLTDGTPAGTRLVADLTPGTESSVFFRAIHANGRSFVDSRAIYVLDAGGLRLAIPDLGQFASFAPCGSGVLVVSRRSTVQEAWWTDGTTSRLLLRATASHPFPFHAPGLPVGGGTVFAFRTPSTGTQLWWTDGTIAGTRHVGDGQFPADMPGPEMFHPFSGDVLFARRHPLHGNELWRTDGTALGTRLVADVDAGPPFASNPSRFVRIGDRLLFRATGRDALGERVFATDGTAAGTVALSGPTPPSSTPVSRGTPWVFVEPDRALFVAPRTTPDPTPVLHATDGTEAGTYVIPDTLHAEVLGRIGSRLVLRTRTWQFGDELLVTDGRGGDATSIDILPGQNSSFPQHGLEFSGKVYFVAGDAAHGNELWVTDGTVAGTQLVADIDPGRLGSEPSTLKATTTHFWFSARTLQHGRELWISDGTTAGTRLVFDLLPGLPGALGNSAPVHEARRFTEATAALGHRLAFAAATIADNSRFAWLISDGTAGGTTSLPIGPGLATTLSAGAMRTVADVVYWSTRVGTATSSAAALLVTDGTAAGTRALLVGPPGSTVTAVDAADGRTRRALFALQTPTEGSELWITDGTVAGTQPFGRGLPGPASGASGELGRLGDRILLAADDGTTGMELYAIRAGDAGIAAVDTYGTACPSGVAPTFTANGAPAIGATFTLAIDGARVLAPGVLLFGARTDLPLGPCRVLVQPSVAIGIVTDATGAARIALPIPRDPSLVGALAHTQPAIADPAGALGVVAFGNGLAILIGR